jgi:hypothetical protein
MSQCIRSIITYIIFGVVIIVGYFMIDDFGIGLKFQEFFYLIINILICHDIKKYKGSYCELILVFLFLLFFFGGVRIVADLFGLGVENIRTSMFLDKLISEKSTLRTVFNENIAVLGLGIGQFSYYAFFYKTSIIHKPLSIRINNLTFYGLLFVGLAAKMYTAALLFTNLVTYGYHAMFSGDGGVSIPIYLRALQLIPIFIILCKVAESKKWLYLLGFYLLLDLATGQRGFSALTAIAFVYYLTKLQILNLNIAKITVAVVIAMVVFIFMSNFRNEKATTLDDVVLNEFLWEQGTSINVLQCSIEEAHNLDYSVKDLFGNVYSTFSKFDDTYNTEGKTTLEQTLHYKCWSKYISYHMDPSRYWAGLGMGGNYLGQLFVVGREGFLFLVNFLIPFFLGFLEKKVFGKNPISVFFFFNVLLVFLYIPRDNLFQFLTSSIEPALVSLLLYLLLKLGVKRKNKLCVKRK